GGLPDATAARNAWSLKPPFGAETSSGAMAAFASANRDCATSSPFVPNPMMLRVVAFELPLPSGRALAAVVTTATRSPRSTRATPTRFHLPDIRLTLPEKGPRPRFAPVWERNHTGRPDARKETSGGRARLGRRG